MSLHHPLSDDPDAQSPVDAAEKEHTRERDEEPLEVPDTPFTVTWGKGTWHHGDRWSLQKEGRGKLLFSRG